MSKNLKNAIVISIIIFIIIASILFFFVFRYFANKKKIEYVYETYSNVQDRLDTEKNTLNDDFLLQIDGESVIGVVKIEKIGFEGLVFEGTKLDTLDKGVGHFESSRIFDGNVCLAAHNYINMWKELYKVSQGDTIQYACVLGQKTYKVCDIKEIEYTDISVLENTIENRITLITCIKNNPSKRLLVQAIEI
ncbi:MAG: sortase [Clostridia bacterium]|nr:sortase [Clostridia bacterium]